MAVRELVMGGNCPVPGSSSSSNPLASLGNALMGSSSRKDMVKEIPTSIPTTSGSNMYEGPLTVLPGSEFENSLQPSGQGSEFLRSMRSADPNGFSDAWNEVNNHHAHHFQNTGSLTNFPLERARLQPDLDGPPQRVLSSFLHSFVNSSHGGVPFRSAALPVLGLSESEKTCIRDRSSIMARHFFADKSEDFVNSQVNALLSSLDIETDMRGRGGVVPGRYRELEEYWNDSSQVINGRGDPNGWANEFTQHMGMVGGADPNAWAHSFQQQHGPAGWASEFEHEQSQITTLDHMRGANIPSLAAMEQTRMLAHTLAQNEDPKFQNSKFFQFVSKMSRGELSIEDNQVKASSAGGDWATEYQHQHFNNGGGQSWADQFVREEMSSSSHGPERWVNEYSREREKHVEEDEWVSEFSKLHVHDWVDEFGRQVGEGVLGDEASDQWAASYDDYVNDQKNLKLKSDTSRGVYVFSDLNPYVGHPNPLKEGQDLFRKGLLSEAVLALEAEVLKNPENAEGWRLLGIAHAENDDDQQAIASMMRAQEVEPTNLEVLLALGVSHTNELEQAAALKYLYSWLRHHPKYKTIAPQEQQQPPALYYADVARYFNDAAQMSPDDADVHVVLGVLYNLSREYDKAIESFKMALKLKPRDYSLWNKLGATQANSVQSADAILAYQQALDLKPNYVRAWANMGISYANQGMYEDSIRYYVRALAMNPKADNAWQYLRISLSCASRNDMIEACDSRNLDVLQKVFPL